MELHMKYRILNRRVCISAAALSAALCFLCGCSVQLGGKSRTVTVNGSGVVSVESDIARIRLAVVTADTDVRAASAANAARMSRVQEAVSAQGVPAEQYSTDGYNIYQESSYINGRTVRGEYRVTNGITILVSDIDTVGSVIDAAIAAGANELSSVSFAASSTEDAVREARVLAVNQAAEAAALLAGTAGAELGKVIEIVENSFVSPRSNGTKLMAAADSAGGPTPVTAGQTDVQVQVTVTYALK